MKIVVQIVVFLLIIGAGLVLLARAVRDLARRAWNFFGECIAARLEMSKDD